MPCSTRRPHARSCGRRFPSEGPELVPGRGGVDGALGRVVAATFAAMLDGELVAAEGVPARRLRLGVLRPLEQRERHVVLDGGLRRPREGGRLLPAAPGRRLRYRG